MKVSITVLLFLGLVSCSWQRPGSEVVETTPKESEWRKHPRKPLPNIFGGSGGKTSLKYGFYEQAGVVASNASWEAVAHYSYLGYSGAMIGNAGDPYAFSPSGRFVVIPKSYLSGSERHVLKIYDKKSDRFVLREVTGLTIRDYGWSKDERAIEVRFEEPGRSESITVPEP